MSTGWIDYGGAELAVLVVSVVTAVEVGGARTVGEVGEAI